MATLNSLLLCLGPEGFVNSQKYKCMLNPEQNMLSSKERVYDAPKMSMDV